MRMGTCFRRDSKLATTRLVEEPMRLLMLSPAELEAYRLYR